MMSSTIKFLTLFTVASFTLLAGGVDACIIDGTTVGKSGDSFTYII